MKEPNDSNPIQAKWIRRTLIEPGNRSSIVMFSNSKPNFQVSIDAKVNNPKEISKNSYISANHCL